MPDGSKPADPGIELETPPAARLWAGTVLCPEAQGDGVPCRGADGECEICGRALPVTPAQGLALADSPAETR